MSKEMPWRRRIHHKRHAVRAQPMVRHMLIGRAFTCIAARRPSRGYIVRTKSRLAARLGVIKMTLQSPVRRPALAQSA